jgi:protein phosphatase 2C-like protein
MHVLTAAFWLPKAGNTPEEYEDAFWPRKSIDRSTPIFRCAIADGATETSCSSAWAQALVRAYCRGHLYGGKTFHKHLTSLQQQWKAAVSQKPLPWYAEEKLRQGAFSSLLGLTIRGGQGAEQLQWNALAVGDSCLFQIREDKVITQFPLTCSDQFTNRPVLLSSNPASNDRLADHIRPASGQWHDGDAFYLMTDAIACWFLRADERGEAPWVIIRDLGTEDGRNLEEWIACLREEGRLSNDDVTIVRVDALVSSI